MHHSQWTTRWHFGLEPGSGVIDDACGCQVVSAGVSVAIKVFLDGAYVSATGLMRDNLRSLPGFPLAHPYISGAWGHSGTETISAAILTETDPALAIVDWVLIELRDRDLPATVITKRAALVQRDGDVVDLDGTSPLSFGAVAAGEYHIVIRHRNHLGIMTGVPVMLSGTPAIVDLTLASTLSYGTNARKTVGSVMTLWGGNATSTNAIVNYLGINNDRQTILNSVGATTPNSSITSSYHNADVNLNGTVNYLGINNDRQYLLNTVGATTPNSSRTQQLP